MAAALREFNEWFLKWNRFKFNTWIMPGHIMEREEHPLSLLLLHSPLSLTISSADNVICVSSQQFVSPPPPLAFPLPPFMESMERHENTNAYRQHFLFKTSPPLLSLSLSPFESSVFQINCVHECSDLLNK